MGIQWNTWLDLMVALSVVLTLMDLYLAKKCWEDPDSLAHLLGFTALFAAGAELTYTLCAISQHPYWQAFYFNIYCISVDWMFLGMLAFLFRYSSSKPAPIWKYLGTVFIVWASLETICFALNPLWKLTAGYVIREDSPLYVIALEGPHMMHFLYSYVLMALSFGFGAIHFLRAPKPYRNQFGYIVGGMLLVLLLNVVSPWPQLAVHSGYSLRGHSYVLMIMCWTYFSYTRRDLQKGLSVEIFENIGQGIVLFDYDNLLMMQNNRAQELLTGVRFEARMPVAEFLSQLTFPSPRANRENPCTSQCYLSNGTAVRCDFRPLRNEKGKKLGELYVFTESDLDMDLLTGFQRWESFLKQCAKHPVQRKRSVAVFDVNKLGEINSREGVNEGDRQIRLLASTMRKCLPADTKFVRGQDAVLIAVCNDFDGDMMRQYAENVRKAYERETLYAICEAEDAASDPVALVEDAMHGLLVKKLLDSNSSHSQTLTSLVRALQECDSDTEAHVQRTQKLGRELGNRIGLTDCQQSDLSLLCLLHDIGKIGIPLDILNKPFRLSAEERALIRSHAEKGYQIAMSSDKLSFIADMIRHHHERWDGRGYPDGLSREEIPLLSRIIAVVDAYDAMTNDRTYHKGIPIAKALEEIHRCSGTQFEPIIAAEFIRMIREMYADTLSEQESAPKVETKVVDSRQAQVDASAVNVYPILFSRYLLDANNRIIDADTNFERITGYTEADWKNGELTQMSMLPPDARQEYGAFLATQLRNSTFAYLEHRLRRKDGSELFVFCYGEVFYDHSVKEQRSQIFITDITTSHAAQMMIMAESSKSEKQLRYWEEMYRRDPTTGLLNHIAFQNDVEAMLHKKDQRVLLMMLNVDHFNKYTDAYGHDAGDRLLRELGRTMKDVSRAADMCCRMGGDEFAIAFLIDPGADRQQIWNLAERLYDELTHTLKAIHPEWSLSAGLAISDNTARTFKELYRLADAALYQVKREGRGKMFWPSE